MSSLIADHPSVSPLLTERVQRAKLLDGMVRAVADKGFAAATVTDAVRLARVSRGTFYELFDKWGGIFAYGDVEVNGLQEVFGVLLMLCGDQDLHLGEEGLAFLFERGISKLRDASERQAQ